MIRVSESTKRKLLRLKGEFGVETYNEVVMHLMRYYEQGEKIAQEVSGE